MAALKVDCVQSSKSESVKGSDTASVTTKELAVMASGGGAEEEEESEKEESEGEEEAKRGEEISAAGIAFGGSREGKMISSNRPSTSSETVTAKPTPYNVLLISDNDIGMLNSELYAAYTINKRLSINAGLTFLFSEYTTAEKISYNEDNDRFRYKSLMGMLSIHFKPFN